jgi:hypothetical protein
MKRGMGSLVGVILLVGIVVTTAIVLLNFFDVFSQDQTDNIENETLEREYCDNSIIELNNICSFDDFGPSPDPGLKLQLKNVGSVDIDSINLTFYDLDANYDTGILNFGGIVRYGFLEHEFNDLPQGRDYDKIIIIKHLVTEENIEITCEADVIELNTYPIYC